MVVAPCQVQPTAPDRLSVMSSGRVLVSTTRIAPVSAIYRPAPCWTAVRIVCAGVNRKPQRRVAGCKPPVHAVVRDKE